MAKEIISNIRIVTTFGRINSEQLRYKKAIDEEQKQTNHNNILSCLQLALFSMFIPLCLLGLLYFSTTYKILGQGINKNVVPDTISFFLPIVSLVFLKANYKNFTKFFLSSIAARKVFKAIKHQTEIDPLQNGFIKKRNNGALEIRNVTFKYPMRDEPILRNLNLSIPAGKTVALVGPS